MQKDAKKFLFDLLTTPSPSGFEQRIQRVVKKRIEKYADEIIVDVHGNLMAAFNPDGEVRVMLAGHCDQIALMITHIDDSGFISVSNIGGLDSAILPGSPVRIHTREGAEVPGVIGHPPAHLTEPSERGKKVELKKIWIDIGAKDSKDAKKRVSVGDPITFDLRVIEMGKSVIAAPACDDKIGLFAVMEAFRLVATAYSTKEKKKKFPIALYSVSTVQEELGLRGARTACYAIDPAVGIAVDAEHASDNPGGKAKQVGTVDLGSGAIICRGANINPKIEELLVSTARKKKIEHQLIGEPRATGTDANAMQISRAGVAAALVGIPTRYMHTQVETVNLNDLQAAAKLLAETVMAIKPSMSFIPI